MSNPIKLILVLMIASLVVATASAATFPNKRDMLGGVHDLTGSGLFGKTANWSGRTVTSASSVCGYCHTAHDNESEIADRTWLWSHEIPSTFGTPYTSPTLQGAENVTVTSQSAKCLGCHDGTLALSSGAYGTAPQTGSEFSATVSGSLTQLTTGGKLSYPAFIVPLSRTHPVSIAYTAANAAAHNMRAPAGANSVDAAGNIPLFNGYMECATCHDPHLKSGIMRRTFPTGPGVDAPATAATGSSSFCLYCHQ